MPDGIKFTINVGVFIKSLLVFRTGAEKAPAKVIINDCHWSERIGNLMPVKQDFWWIMYEWENPEILFTELKEVFEQYVFTMLCENVADETFLSTPGKGRV